MTERISNWRRKYDEFIITAFHEPFRWGEHDCVMFAAKTLDLQYDIGLMAYIRANFQYWDEDTAIELVNEFTNLEGLISNVLGIDPVPPAHLTVGDIALYDYGSVEFPFALAVHDGHQLLTTDTVGLRSLPLDRAIKGWKL